MNEYYGELKYCIINENLMELGVVYKQLLHFYPHPLYLSQHVSLSYTPQY